MNIKHSDLDAVLKLAEQQVEDVRSGLEEGLYEAADNESHEVNKSLVERMRRLCEADQILSAVDISHWDSARYDGERDSDEPKFKCEVTDYRQVEGRLLVDVRNDENSNDVLCLTVSVDTLPGTTRATQTLHVNFDDERLAFSIYKRGDGLELHTDTGDLGVRLERVGSHYEIR